MLKMNLQFFGGRGGGSGKAGGGGGARANNVTSAPTTDKISNDIMNLYASSNVNTRMAISSLRDAKNETRASASGIKSTLQKASSKEGVFNSDFNDATTRARAQSVLNKVAPNQYEFRQVTVAKNTNIPGFNFMGYNVKGNITEWRLFKK